MELSDIRSEVRIRSGLNPNDALANDAAVTSLINSALRQMASAHDWPWHYYTAPLTFTVGTSSVAHATDARVITTVELDEFRGTLKLVTQDFAAKYSDRTGIPRFWYAHAGNIYFTPKAAQTYTGTHTYLAEETVLVDDTDEPLCPDYAIDWVIITAARQIAARLDNTSQYRLLAEEGKRILDGLVDDARKARPTPTINSRRDWHV